MSGAIQTSVNGGNITNSALSGSGVTAQNFGPVATGVSTSPFTVTYAPTTAGALSGQAVHIANNFSNVAEQTMSITGAAYALASPTVASSLTPQFNFGVVQVGQTVHDPLTITNSLVAGNAAFQEGLNASFGTLSTGFLTTNGGAITNLAAGQSNGTSMVVNLTPTNTGTVSGTVPVSFASNGSGTSGLGITPLSGQNLNYVWSFSGTVVNPANPSIAPTSIDFGNVRINTLQQQALGVANIAGTPPQASLDAQISAVGPATSNNRTINQLAPGSTNNTSLIAGLSTAIAGAQSGTATVALQSDSTPNGCTSNCIVNLAPQNIGITANVFRLATGSAISPADIGAARVGIGTLSGNLSVTNTAANDGFSEKLNAGITATTPAVTGSGGSVTGLAAGQTNTTGLQVTLDNSSAGAKSGTAMVQFQSDGTGIDGGAPINNGSQTVTVNGKVYTPATANVVTASPIDFGILHVGDSGPSTAKSVTVQNAALTTALNDVLVGSIGAGGAPFSGSGNLGAGLGPQASSSALQVNLNTATAGQFSGTANLALASHDADLADLPLGTNPLSLNAQVNLYAALGFTQQGGPGSLTSGGNAFDLDFGNVAQGSSQDALLAILNDNPLADQLFTDLLSSTGTILSGSGFNFNGCSVNNVAGGVSQSGCDISFDTSSVGNFTELLSFDVESSNPGGYDQIIGNVTLTLEGSVGLSPPSVPEPGTISVLASGFGALFFLVRRRRRVQ